MDFGEGERVLALESREGTRASRRVEEGLSISLINLFLTNVEFDPKVYWNIFLSAYLSRRANWRAVVGVRGAGRVKAQSMFFYRHVRALGN